MADRFRLIVPWCLLCGALVACSGEQAPGRFEDDGGAGGATTGSTSSTSAGGATGVGGAGTGGASPTTQVVCLEGSLTVEDLSLTEGDAEFDGNGPVVRATVEVSTTAEAVVLSTCVEMKETVPDFTTGSRCVDGSVAIDNVGLVTTPSFLAQYTDTDHEPDNVLAEATTLQNDHGLVATLQCIGDTEGDDICGDAGGSCSKCLFSFGCVEVMLP